MENYVVTVVMAIITFLSGFIGATIGAVLNNKNAEKEREAKRQYFVHQEKVEAYKKFFDALDAWAEAPEDIASKRRIQRGITDASLFASDNAVEMLNELGYFFETFKEANMTTEKHEEFLRLKGGLFFYARTDINEFNRSELNIRPGKKP